MSALDEDRRLMRQWLASGSLDAKSAWLDLRCNAYPYDSSSGNLEVAWRTLDSHSRWMSWLDVRDDPRVVAKINQALIPRPFLVLDLDPLPDETPADFERRISTTKRAVLADGGRLVSDCTTGSRGRHLEFLVWQWAGLSRETVRTLKASLISHYGADDAKAAPRCMLHLAGMPNPKTGRRKHEVHR